MKNFDLWMSISGSLLIAAPIQAQKKAKEKQPNVIFIIADDLGYGDMSCYGAHRVQTPHVDALASSGIRYGCACGSFNEYTVTLFFIHRTLCLA